MRLLLQGIHGWDVSLFTWMMAHERSAILARAGRWISRTADGPLYVLLAAWLYWVGEKQLVQALAVAFVIERISYLILKNSLRRNRPANAIPGFDAFIRPSDEFSFPSGHTSGAFLMAFYLIQLFPGVGPLFYAWAMSVAFSRLFLGVHFPTDTFMGALMGTLFGWLSFQWLLS